MDLQTFIKKAQWSPNSGMDSAANYSGPDLSEYLQGPGRSRDSDILAESNFAAALEMLGGESDLVEVHRFGHWGCGWFEVILVKNIPESTHHIQTLFEIHQLLEQYPVLDDSDYYERESEERDQTIENNLGEFCQTILDVLCLEDSEVGETELESLARDIFAEDCSYCGNDDAWVTEASIARYAETYEARTSDCYLTQYLRSVCGLDGAQ